jgi:hypothetical protein
MVAVLVGAISRPAAGGSITLDFETLADLESLTTQYPGFVFTNTTALVSGIVGGTLDELENPPRSGVTVVGDDGGPVSVQFLTPVNTVSGFFTYDTAVLLSAFDASGNLLGTASSMFTSNQLLTGAAGSSPNEQLSLSFAENIARIEILGGLTGNSFTLDDLTITTGAVVPEPATLTLIAGGALGWLITQRRSRLTRGR